jgi:hypothetical protein
MKPRLDKVDFKFDECRGSREVNRSTTPQQMEEHLD